MKRSIRKDTLELDVIEEIKKPKNKTQIRNKTNINKMNPNLTQCSIPKLIQFKRRRTIPIKKGSRNERMRQLKSPIPFPIII